MENHVYMLMYIFGFSFFELMKNCCLKIPNVTIFFIHHAHNQEAKSFD